MKYFVINNFLNEENCKNLIKDVEKLISKDNFYKYRNFSLLVGVSSHRNKQCGVSGDLRLQDWFARREITVVVDPFLHIKIHGISSFEYF